MSQRWPLGARLLPMTDAEVDTIVTVLTDGVARCTSRSGGRATAPPSSRRASRTPGIEAAAPAPGVLEAIADGRRRADRPLEPGRLDRPDPRGARHPRGAARRRPRRVVGVSPIIGGRVVRGMADVCLTAIGVETSAAAVAAHYGARAAGGLLDAWLIAEEDAASAADVEGLGIRPVVAPLWMRDAATLRRARRGALCRRPSA